MKFTTRVGDLRDALERASKVVPKTPSQAVYAGVRLRVKEGALTVTGSDEGATTVTVTVPITGPAGGDRVLLPKPLIAYLATLPAGVALSADAASTTELTVHAAGGAPYKFRLMEATYPNTSAPTAQVFDTDLSRLGAAVRAVKDCAAGNKVVQVVSTASTGVRLHATDGLRLARASLPEASFGEFSGLLPLGVLELLGEHPITQVALDKRGRIFTASNDTIRVVARMVEEMFPNVDSVLDDAPDHDVTLQTAPLLNALKRLASVSDKRPVLVTIAGDELTLTTDSDSVGSGRERLELDQPVAGEVTFGVNLEFFRDAISAHASGELSLGWSSAVRPLFLRSLLPLPVTTVVMPVRLS